MIVGAMLSDTAGRIDQQCSMSQGTSLGPHPWRCISGKSCVIGFPLTSYVGVNEGRCPPARLRPLCHRPYPAESDCAADRPRVVVDMLQELASVLVGGLT